MTQSVFIPLTDHGLIRASGEEAATFLHNLLTNDITHLPDNGARHAALCTAKGRMIASFLIWREGGDYLLMLSRDILPGILKKLSMYILRSKVKLSDISAERTLFGLLGTEIGPAEPMTTAPWQGGTAIRLDAARMILALPDGSALPPAGRKGELADWHLAEIRAGIPRIVAATQELFTPQMVNYELPAVGGVSFQKGCYPGQEIVARTQYLGKVKRRMYRVWLPAAFPPGSEVFTPEGGDQHCGNVLLCAPSSAGGCEALLVVQTSGAQADAVHLGRPDGPKAQILPLPYPIE